jgi:hypothetical protein
MSQERQAAIVATEQLLVRAAGAFEYPPTPDLSSAVAARLRAEPKARSEWWSAPLPRFAGVSAAALVAVLGVTMIVPASRTALAEFFGLDNVRVEVEPAQTALPTIPLNDLGRASTLGDGEEQLGFPLLLPESEHPDTVFLVDDEAGPAAAILVYDDEAFELWQSKRLNFIKRVPDATYVHEVDVGGADGYWIEPGHVAELEGVGLPPARRGVDRGVLLWQRDGTTYRLEIDASPEEAIAIADSLE